MARTDSHPALCARCASKLAICPNLTCKEHVMTRRSPLALAVVFMTAAALCHAQDRPAAPPSSELSPDKLAALATANQDAMVIVEYTLQYDKGEPPRGSSNVDAWDLPMRFHNYSSAED